MRNKAIEELVNHFLLKTYTKEQVKDMDVAFEEMNDDPNRVAVVSTDTDPGLGSLKLLIEKLTLKSDFQIVSYHTIFVRPSPDAPTLGFYIKTNGAKDEFVQSLMQIYNDDKNEEERSSSVRRLP